MDEWTHTFPRGDLASARLTFESGVAPRLDIRSAPLDRDLARCRFGEPGPSRVELRGDELAIDYRGFFRWLFAGRAAPGVVELWDGIPWAITVRGGIAKTELDLRTLPLTRFEVSGGAAKVELRLGKPRGIVPVRLSGGAAKLLVTHPPGVGARLRISGGAAKVEFQGQSMGAVGGGLALEGRTWDEAGDGYDIKIGGGAASVAVGVEGSA
jgi:hypothetical protein